jgi:hypothetical protein
MALMARRHKEPVDDRTARISRQALLRLCGCGRLIEKLRLAVQ